MADSPMGGASARVLELYRGIDMLLDSLGIHDDERKEVEQQLMEAIAAELLIRLGNRLSEEKRQSLAVAADEMRKAGEPDLAQVANFFKQEFSKDELVSVLTEATESVLKEFAEAMER